MIDHLSGTWGFCGACERWLCSDDWWLGVGDEPRCPRCGNRPSLLEKRVGDHTELGLQLEVAVGPAGSRKFLPDETP